MQSFKKDIYRTHTVYKLQVNLFFCPHLTEDKSLFFTAKEESLKVIFSYTC